MLHMDHIYVVQVYICPMKFNNIYMLLKNMYMLLNRESLDLNAVA